MPVNNALPPVALPDRRSLLAFLIMVAVALMIASMDIYTPAMPLMRDYFGTSDYFMQLSVMAGPFASALVGMVYGRLSDIYGRRPLLFSAFVFFPRRRAGVLFCNDHGRIFYKPLHPVYWQWRHQHPGRCGGWGNVPWRPVCPLYGNLRHPLSRGICPCPHNRCADDPPFWLEIMLYPGFCGNADCGAPVTLFIAGNPEKRRQCQ